MFGANKDYLDFAENESSEEFSDSFFSEIQLAFNWMDENQIFLGILFGICLFVVFLTSNRRRVLFARLSFFLALVSVTFFDFELTKNYFNWLGVEEAQSGAKNWTISWVAAFLGSFLIWRQFGTTIDWLKYKITRQTKIKRRPNTDIIKLSKRRSLPLFLYRIDHLLNKKNQIVLGKHTNLSTCSIDIKSLANQHILIRGSSGYGKSSLLQILIVQWARRREGIQVFNSKNDVDLLRMLYQASSDYKFDFYLIDLESKTPQFALFEGKTSFEIENIILNDRQFQDLGAGADYFTNFDRKAIYTFSQNYHHAVSVSKNWKTFKLDFAKTLKKAEKFCVFMEEILRIPCLDAAPGLGLSLEQALLDGALIYFQCSIYSQRIMRVQPLLVVSISQCLKRTKNSSRPFAHLVIEEAKFFLAREWLSLLSIGRSDRCGITVIHQDRNDFADNSLGINAEAILGAIEANCDTVIEFRAKSISSLEHNSKLSGEVNGEEEIRSFELDPTLSEKKAPVRSLREINRPLINPNDFMMLRKFEAIKFGNGYARKFRFAPLKMPRNSELPSPTFFDDARQEFEQRGKSNMKGPIDVG